MVKEYKKFEKLSEEEIGQIGRYISSDSYKINAKLRGEEELSEFETEYVKKLSGILKKIHRKNGSDLYVVNLREK